MLAGEPLPGLTELTLALSALVHQFAIPIVLLLALVGGIALMFLGPIRGSGRISRYAMRFVPGTQVVALATDYSRMCRIVSLYLARKRPLLEAFDEAATVVLAPSLLGCLKEWRARVAEGGDLRSLAAVASRLDPLMRQALMGPPPELSRSLSDLCKVYEARAAAAGDRAAVLWQMALIVVTGLSVGSLVMSLFMPLIKLIDSLGG
jgi:type II secretory pathway component PulF